MDNYDCNKKNVWAYQSNTNRKPESTSNLSTNTVRSTSTMNTDMNMDMNMDMNTNTPRHVQLSKELTSTDRQEQNTQTSLQTHSMTMETHTIPSLPFVQGSSSTIIASPTHTRLHSDTTDTNFIGTTTDTTTTNTTTATRTKTHINPFGAAKPREEVLARKGIDAAILDQRIEKKAQIIHYTKEQDDQLERIQMELEEAEELWRHANEHELPEEHFRIMVEQKRHDFTHLLDTFHAENEAKQQQYDSSHHMGYSSSNVVSSTNMASSNVQKDTTSCDSTTRPVFQTRSVVVEPGRAYSHGNTIDRENRWMTRSSGGIHPTPSMYYANTQHRGNPPKERGYATIYPPTSGHPSVRTSSSRSSSTGGYPYSAKDDSNTTRQYLSSVNPTIHHRTIDDSRAKSAQNLSRSY